MEFIIYLGMEENQSIETLTGFQNGELKTLFAMRLYMLEISSALQYQVEFMSKNGMDLNAGWFGKYYSEKLQYYTLTIEPRGVSNQLCYDFCLGISKLLSGVIGTPVILSSDDPGYEDIVFRDGDKIDAY